MSSTIINDLASKILEEVEENIKPQNTYGIDPLTIILIIGIIVNVIRVIQECKKDKVKKMMKQEASNYILAEVKYKAANCGWLTKRRIRNIIKEKLTKEQYAKYGESLLKALITAGINATDEQVSSLMEHSHV